MKKLLVIFVSLSLIAALAACSAGAGGGPSSSGTVIVSDASPNITEKKQIVIGLTIAGLSSAYLRPVANYAQAEADRLGVELILTDAEWDAQKQASQIERFIEQKVDAIILNPVDASSMLPSLKKIKDAGIPCINLNMKVDDLSASYITTYVGSSSQNEAQMAADMTNQALGGEGGNVVIIEGAPGSDAQIYRTKSYIDMLTSKYQNIKVLAIANGEWDRSTAMAAARDLMEKYPNIDVMYCQDDNMAIGAIQAAKDADRLDQIKFIGIGGSIDGINAIKSGDLYASVTQPPDFEGATSIDVAVDAANGITLKPWYMDPVEAITIENVDNYVGMW